MNKMTKALAGFALLAFTPVLASCMSQAPYPMTYSFAAQKKLQAAEHWKVYARDVGQTLNSKVQKDRPIYIDRTGKEPVHPILANFLEEQLLNNGFRVAPAETVDALKLTTSTKVIVHENKQISSSVGVVPGILGGMLEVVAGSSSVEDTSKEAKAIDEVVITTKLLDKGEVRLSLNNAFYVNADETWQYDDAPYVANAGHTVSSKKMAIIGD